MRKQHPRKKRHAPAKTVLRLPDLDQAKSAVLNGLTSVDAQRGYRHAIDEFVEWYCYEPRRTCARLCHQAGGELDQIQFLLGHVSVQTTERYPGCKQRIRNAVNGRIGIQPKRRTG